MSTVRATFSVSRALLRPRLQQISRQAANTRRTYADQHPSQKTSSSITPVMIGGVLIGVGGAFYLIRDKQPNVDKSDHAGQASIRTDTPNIAQMNTKDIPAEANANESELPNDAPNNPENKEKMEKKQQQKPASKRADPMK